MPATNRGEANPPLLEFNPAGQLLRSIGVGLFANPHGFTIDKDGNLWTSDTNDKETIFDMSAKDAAGTLIGQTVFKMSPAGKILMTIGKEGGGNGPYLFDRPTGVAVAPNGDIFVSDGHSPNKSNSARIVKYSADGKFIKTWGKLGSEPGNFNEPHDINIGGSKGYVYVADRRNNRVQVFNQDGRFIAAWKQFGQPNSVYVDKHDNLCRRHLPSLGIYIWIHKRPQRSGDRDRQRNHRRTQISHSRSRRPKQDDRHRHFSVRYCTDDQGNIYVADVGFNNLRKYAKVRSRNGVRLNFIIGSTFILGPESRAARAAKCYAARPNNNKQCLSTNIDSRG